MFAIIRVEPKKKSARKADEQTGISSVGLTSFERLFGDYRNPRGGTVFGLLLQKLL